MKNYKNIAYTVIALSLMTFFASTQITSAALSTDFTRGESVGYQEGNKNQSCPVGGSYDPAANAKLASEEYARKNITATLSEDFINGFRNGYASAHSKTDIYCRM